MKFNTKQIFQGDSKKDVVDKINYNFDQILFFGVGPDGHQGPKGATGIFGPAGKKGPTGASGERANKWDSGTNQPSGSKQYDLWIKDDGDLDSYSATGSWNFTGFNFYNSLYFKLYNWLQGPAGVTDKYVIGIKDSLTASNYSFVVSDSSLNSSNSNPNKSKLVISTEDQTIRPIFSFGKSGSSSSGFPSFYWTSSGASNNLQLKSSGDLNILSYLSLKITTDTSNRILFDSLKATISSQGRASFIGNGDLFFNTNTTVGVGTPLIITSRNLKISASTFNVAVPLYIRTQTFGSTGAYALNVQPASPLTNGGIRLEVNGSNSDRIFEIKDLSGSSILSARPRLVTTTSGDFSQTVFGSTGSSAGATAGPYSYHVSKTSLLKAQTLSFNARAYLGANPCGGGTITLQNVISVAANVFANNVIVVTPTIYTSVVGGVYLTIPSYFDDAIPGVFLYGKSNTYRILLDDAEANPLARYIRGIVFFYYTSSSAGCYQYKDFQSATVDQTCRFVDITYLSPANSFNSNPRIFYKTCNGVSGYVNCGQVFPISSPPAPSSTTLVSA